MAQTKGNKVHAHWTHSKKGRNGPLNDDIVQRAAVHSRYYKRLHGQRRSPKGYQDWNSYVARLILASAELLPGQFIAQMADADPITTSTIRICHQIIKIDAPVRYLTPEITTAFLATALPKKLESFPKPLPAVQLFLPDGAVLDEQGFCIRTIQVVDNGEIEDEITINGMTLKPRKGHLRGISINGVSDSGMSYNATWLADPADWGQVEHIARTPPALNLDPEGIEAAVSRVTHVAVNAWLAMGIRPDLICTGNVPAHSTAVTGRDAKGKRVPLAPIWLGFRYKLPPRIYLKSTETGRSVRPHWRCGFYRQQRYGRDRQSVKIIWIEPTYVGIKN